MRLLAWRLHNETIEHDRSIAFFAEDSQRVVAHAPRERAPHSSGLILRRDLA